MAAIVLSYFTVSGCHSPKQEVTATFDLVKTGKEIAIQLRAYENGLKNGDSTAIEKLYTPDAELFHKGGPSTIGRENMAKALGEMIRDSTTGSGFTTTGLWGDAEMLAEAEPMLPPLSMLIDRIDYIIKLVGVDYVGLGSDFDSTNLTPQQLDDVTIYPLITKAMVERGYSKRYYENSWRQFFKSAKSKWKK